MGRAPCCDKANVKKGPWSPEEDAKLKEFIEKYGTCGNWIALPQKAGLKRCGKSCRLRWLNYLRPNIKHGEFSDDEDRIICSLYASIGSRWSIIAAQLPGRTDNDIKNYWNTKLKKKLMGLMIPLDQRKLIQPFSNSLQTTSSTQYSQSLSSRTSLSQLYRDCSPNYFTSTTKSLTGFESISSVHSNLLYDNTYNLQGQEGLLGPMQFYPGKDKNMLIFGGGATDQASCSSSDGSCNQISYGNKEIKQENMNGSTILQDYLSNYYNANYDPQEHQQFILDYGNNNGAGGSGDQISTWWAHHYDQKPNVFSSNITDQQLEYDLEELKQLISSSNEKSMYNNY
ncbi:hypothetical protein ACH5RR_009834 [Cinchona calisaya]|uniref:Uncharacterized protein n=1 Tax=Cinchona calisaya TaxID=153742 RepID=A0ABD3AHN6_9GENT